MSARLAGYPAPAQLVERFESAARRANGEVSTVGVSVEGRPLARLDLGTKGRPTVLLTALMHGVEVVGAMALLNVLERLGEGDALAKKILDAAHLVVLPVVNPDAFAVNMDKLAQGNRAWQRCNANGVDLNRNFARLTTKRQLHPFSGSRFRWSPHYAGLHAFSEPESRAVRQTAIDISPRLSLAFHSFGNMLLYPYAYTDRPHPRIDEYRALGDVLNGSLATPYEVRSSRQLYSILGDMDDWLDAELGTLAFTVEVSRPSWRLGELRHVANPFCWMNPARVDETVQNLTPGIVGLMARALDIDDSVPVRPGAPAKSVRPGLDFAAK